MYDLNSRVSLIAISVKDHSLLEVLAEDVSVAEAFGLAREAGPRFMAEEVGAGGPYLASTAEFVILGVGEDWSSVKLGDAFYQYDDDNTAYVACFAGPEDGWGPMDESEEEGYVYKVVWEDGGTRGFTPND